MRSIIARFLTGQRTYTTEDLISAIHQESDISEIEKIIVGVADVNHAPTSGPYEGNTPLYVAAFMGCREALQLLLDRGADINLKSNRMQDTGKYAHITNGLFKSTPLLIAVQNGHTEIVAQLLTVEGVDVNQADNDGKTPLWVAAYYGRAVIVAQLLAAEGIDVNQASTSRYDAGNTPLYITAKKGHTEIAAQLLTVEGVDVNQADNDGKTPLFIAAYFGCAEIVAQLLSAEGIDVNLAPISRYDAGSTPLYIAAEKGHTEIVAQLLAAGADVTKANQYGKTPLFIAAYYGHVEIVAQLLSAEGIDVNLAPISGYDAGNTPLYIAAKKGHAGIVTQLLAVEDVDVNQASTSSCYAGSTPLYIAAEKGRTEIVAQLLAAGADVTKANQYGKTPLFIAAQSNHTAVALLLKLAGARRGDIDFEKNDAVIKQAIKTSDLLQIITQRFPESSMDLHTALDESLDNITDIDTLFKFSIDLKNKFNQIIHPISTANISHMVNQFLPSKLSGKLIGKILNLEILALDKQDLRGAINTGAIVAQIITDRLQGAAAQEVLSASRSREQDPVSELIIRIKQLDTRGVDLSSINISERDGGYIYNCDVGNRAVAMSEKPLTEITPSEKAELLSKISQKEEILSLQDPTSVTDVEDESFVSRVKAGKTQAVSCNVM